MISLTLLHSTVVVKCRVCIYADNDRVGASDPEPLLSSVGDDAAVFRFSMRIHAVCTKPFHFSRHSVGKAKFGRSSRGDAYRPHRYACLEGI